MCYTLVGLNNKQELTRFVLHIYLSFAHPFMIYALRCLSVPSITVLTLNPLTWKIWCTPNNASIWQMGFNSAFKGLNLALPSQY